MNVNLSSPTPAAPPAELIKESSDRAFKADVIDASLEAPVLVDFWAPWCGPCRALTPTIEKVIREKAGKIRLVKINIDENPQIAGQLGVQSIPNVFAFAGGRPVDMFLGNLPETEVRKFADRVIAAAGPGKPRAGSIEEEIKNALGAAKAALDGGDLGTAAQIYGMVLQHQADNSEALLGMARVYLKAGEAEQAQAVLDTVPEAARTGADYLSIAAELKLLAEAAALGGTADLAHKVEAAPDDHQARFDLAIALNAEGKRAEAAEQLVTLLRRDRTWEDDRARKKLLEFFEAWGAKDPATLKGRRLLSSLLFS
ncbi:MAG: co-chaperone YbbN [Devosia sp. 67-54]|uniref:thioredoxin family protein n=1 Tax=unclassified Devosia TaxID=196773 RepID=UPI00095A1313|nr:MULTISPECIES: co-chaperone YbbN [unclassified Devosia]MBN9305192.1 co-chaperone YbbN [Devosia sp.]OJX14886.1 MAG: co-chaperone YbbN [Devosia sp. 67-54]